MKEWLKDRWETSWVYEFWVLLSEMKRQGSVRYFLETYWRMAWAATRLRLGLGLEFRRSVVEAAEAAEARDKEEKPEEEASVVVTRFEECRARANARILKDLSRWRDGRRPRRHGVLAFGWRVLGGKRHAWAGDNPDC